MISKTSSSKKKIQVPVACLAGWHLMKGNDKFINLNLMNV